MSFHGTFLRAAKREHQRRGCAQAGANQNRRGRPLPFYYASWGRAEVVQSVANGTSEVLLTDPQARVACGPATLRNGAEGKKRPVQACPTLRIGTLPRCALS